MVDFKENIILLWRLLLKSLLIWLSKKQYWLRESGFAMCLFVNSCFIANVCKDCTKNVFSLVMDFGICAMTK